MDATQNSRFLGWPVVLLAGLAAFAQSTGYTKSLLGHPSTPIAVGPKQTPHAHTCASSISAAPLASASREWASVQCLTSDGHAACACADDWHTHPPLSSSLTQELRVSRRLQD